MTKDRLSEYSDLKAEVLQLEMEIKYLYESCIASPMGSFGDESLRSVGSVSDPTGLFAERAAKLYTKLLMKKYELVVLLEEIEDAIDKLEPIHRRLIREYYINGLKWEQVCDKIGYAWAQTHRLHREALSRLVCVGKIS